MLLLSTTSLSQTVVSHAAASFSPSAHPLMRRVGAHFRYDPYKPALLARAAAAAAAAAVVHVSSPTHPDPASPSASVQRQAPPAAPRATVSPVFAAIPSSVPRFATVLFKVASKNFRAPFRITVGDLVVVDGDRGEDIGVVKHITTSAPNSPPASSVLRRARDADRAALELKTEREAEALAFAKTASASLRLNAEVADVEFQLDLSKLTVFVSRATKTTFVDFRKLQRLLFKHCKCRIWCAFMDEVALRDSRPQPTPLHGKHPPKKTARPAL